MHTSIKFQVITALLLLAACVTAALLGMPRQLAQPTDDLVKQNAITQEVASTVAMALDAGTLEELSASIDSLLAQHPELLAVEVAPVESTQTLSYGAVQKLREHTPTSASRAHKISLVRGGQPWGSVHVLFASSSPGLPAKGGMSWVIVVLAVLVLPLAVVLIEVVRRRLDRSANGPMVIAAARAQHTLDTLAEGVLLLDDRESVVFVNTAFCEVAGLTPSDCLGKPIANLAWVDLAESGSEQPPPPPTYPWALVRHTGQACRGLRMGLKRESGTISLIANCTPLFRKHGVLHGILVTLDDVTELEQSRLEIRDARDAAQHANEAKSRFLAMMSHEIRTPLNGVCGTLQLLKKTPLQQAQSQYIEAATFSASTLLHLINDVLDLSKIEAGQLELSPIDFDLEECVDKTMLMMVQAARNKGLVLAYDIAPEVATHFKGDPDRIRQIVINLINNAIKFTERGSVSLTVSVQQDSPDRQMLRCAVTDTGIGIPANKLHRLFKAFSQVDSSTSRKYGGTGLGLVISKQLCEAMGGQIEVSSTEGVGTTFTFTLDLPRIQPPPASPEPSINAGTRSAITIGIHNLESKRVQHALGLSIDAVRALPNIEALTTLLHDDPSLAHNEDMVVVVAVADNAPAQLARVREALPSSSIQILPAQFGHEASSAADVPGLLPTLHRPVGSTRLVRAITSSEASASAESAQAAAKARPTTLTGIRVLLAEDNPVGQMVVADMLRGFGATCNPVGDGNAVLAALQQAPYDIVLMDCFMPEFDGFEATKRIRELQRAGTFPAQVPIVALTAKAMRGDREACLEAGMDGYVTKPVDQDELFQAVAKHALRPPTQPAPSESPPSKPGVDSASLRERYAGKPTLLKQLTEAFRSTAAEDLKHIEEAIATRDARRIEHAAHRLAGGAGFVAAHEARRLAVEIERLGSQQQIDGLQAVAQQLKNEVDAALGALEQVISTSPAPSTAPMRGKETA